MSDVAAELDALRIALGETEALAALTAESYDRQDWDDADPLHAERLASLLGLISKSATGALSAFHRLHGAVADAQPAPAGERWDHEHGTAPGEGTPMSDAEIVKRLRERCADGALRSPLGRRAGPAVQAEPAGGASERRGRDRGDDAPEVGGRDPLALALLYDASHPELALQTQRYPSATPDRLAEIKLSGLWLCSGNKEGRYSMQKSRLHVLASFAVFAVAGVSVSSSAHAASSTTCTGSSTLGYSPGLTFTSHTTSVSETDTFSSCTSTDTSLTSGSFSATFTAAGVSCDKLDASGPVSDFYEISWNNSQSSTIDATAATVAIVGGNQVFTLVGTVSSGEFTGDDVTVTWVYPLVNLLQCLTSQGVTGQSGTVAVEIVGL